MTFVTTKTYFNLETSLGLAGVIWFYGIIDILGLIFIYLMLPETENRTLEDIETHFSDNKRKLTDIKIKKSSKANTVVPDPKTPTTVPPVSTVENEMKKANGCDNKGYIEH